MITFYHARSQILFFATAVGLLAGCWGDASSPLRSEADVRAFVAQAHAQQHGDSAAAASTLAGIWEGELLLGSERQEVTGVATQSGLVVLRQKSNGASWVVAGLTVRNGQWSGSMSRTLGNQLQSFAVLGAAQPNRFVMLLAPVGWTLADLSNGRVATADEAARFGRLTLSRSDAQATAKLSDLASAQQQGGTSALTLDTQGNFTLQFAGCTLSGGAAFAAGASGVLNLAGVANGVACDANGLVTGAAWPEGDAGRFVLVLTAGSRSMTAASVWPVSLALPL
jgi:hypothetical protein